jgi:energy-coupling factor transporter ATP-binding protein EcfA2
VSADPHSGAITRVTCVSLYNYRGFKSNPKGEEPAHRIDTDADLVLITGPNGYGKTSLLEGLLLLLTGWYGDADPVRDLIAHQPRPRDGGEAKPAGDCRLYAEVRRRVQPPSRSSEEEPHSTGNPAEEESHTIEIKWLSKHVGPLPMPDGARSQFPRATESNPAVDRELDARLCAFSQDRIKLQFDQAAEGFTLRDVFEPLPNTVKRMLDLLPRLVEDLQADEKQDKYAAEWNGEAPEELNQRLGEAWGRLHPVLCNLLMGRDAWPEEAALPVEVADDQALDPVARVAAAALGVPVPDALQYEKLETAFRKAVEQELEDQIETAERDTAGATEKTAKLLKELQAVDQELDEIKRKFPSLDKDVTALVADTPELPDALATFRALAANAQRWSRARIPDSEGEGPARFRRALEELAAVQEQEAAKCAEAIGVWLDERRAAHERRSTLIKKRHDLVDELRRSQTSERLEALRSLRRDLGSALTVLSDAWAAKHEYTEFLQTTEGRSKARELLRDARSAASWCLGALKAISKPDRKLMEALRERADWVLRRFSLVDGFLPLCLEADDDLSGAGEALHRGYRIKTGDGRELAHFSTGQRAQVAVSMLVAQNLMVPQKLTHRTILLDDVTTAYDLGNLTREAILWRQLAYGAEDEQQRRQVFLSSHHEDMTNHLLDLLVPPEGRRMLLIRFTAWSRDDGPTYDIFDVTATQASDSAGKCDLIKNLEEF